MCQRTAERVGSRVPEFLDFRVLKLLATQSADTPSIDRLGRAGLASSCSGKRSQALVGTNLTSNTRALLTRGGPWRSERTSGTPFNG